MFKKLQFKVILVLVSFIILVLTVVGIILISNIFNYYTSEFLGQQEEVFTKSFQNELSLLLETDDPALQLKNALNAHSARMGIDSYRNYYVLTSDGEYMSGSTDRESADIRMTENLLSAISGESSHIQSAGNKVMDYATVIPSSNDFIIVYVVDSKEEMNEFSMMVFSILIQSLLVGLVLALILSLILSNAITAPIQNITKKATSVAEGNFDEKLAVHSNDEIGTLTSTFNKMAEDLESTMREISGERQKLETIFYYLNDAVIAFDSDGRLLHINPTAKELFAEFVDTMSLDKLIDELDLESLSESVHSNSDHDALIINNVNYKSNVFDISFGKLRFDLSDGVFGGYITVLHDITEHFELEKSRREFIANVSHELGTPLTSIKGAAETIATNPDMPEEIQASFLQMVIGESDRMSHIVKELLVISRLDNKRMMWNPSSFSLSDLLTHCIEVVRGEADNCGHTLSLTLPTDTVPSVEADREKVEQVLLNLIQNAIKYTQSNGKIDVSLEFLKTHSTATLPNGDWFCIKVSDNGTGIPEDDIPHIFERFYRVEKARSSDKGGTGLGLAIAKEIALEHGGDIEIESTVGVGTTFTVYLPCKAKYIQ
ncbi:MAG: HAMP domain-containing protein [Clostridia bacterium]|nr:HAMP domain-containing protein [Clostridia bacterium]